MLDIASLIRISAAVLRVGVPAAMLLLYLAAVRDGTVRDRERPFEMSVTA